MKGGNISLDVLNNPWFIGTMTGIVSGTFVYWLTNKFFSKQNQIEHRKAIDRANDNIVQNVKSFFIQDQILDLKIIESMIKAVAIKNNLDRKELFSIKDIGGFLINEFMETSFLSIDKKKKICEDVYKALLFEQTNNNIVNVNELYNIQKSNIESSKQLSLTMSLMTSAMSLIIVVTSIDKNSVGPFFSSINDFKIMFTSVFIAILTAILSTFILIIKKKSYFKSYLELKKNKNDIGIDLKNIVDEKIIKNFKDKNN